MFINFKERGWGEKERHQYERWNIDELPPMCAPGRESNLQPRFSPDRESNPQPFVLWWDDCSNQMSHTALNVITLILKIFYLFLFKREGKGRRKRRRETVVALTTQHVSWLGIEPVTLWFPGPCSGQPGLMSLLLKSAFGWLPLIKIIFIQNWRWAFFLLKCILLLICCQK